MPEDIGTIINKGINTWVRNLNICVPFILNSIAQIIITSIYFILMSILLLASQVESGLDLEALPPEDFINVIITAFLDNIEISVASLIVFFLTILFIQIFFEAGAIGMAKEANEKGDCRLSDLLHYGSKHTLRLFLTTILIGLLMLVGLIFIVPGAQAVDLSLLLKNPNDFFASAGVELLKLGILIWGLYIFLISLLMTMVPYALVLEELDPIEAVSTGLSFFMDNKLSVILIWGLNLVLSFTLGHIQQYFAGSSLMTLLTSLLSIAILLPLTTIWWTRLYLDRKGKKLHDYMEILTDSQDFMNS